jgi:hypothetical protein
VVDGETLPVLDCCFLATVEPDEIRINRAEASEVRWFDLRQPARLALRQWMPPCGMRREF